MAETLTELARELSEAKTRKDELEEELKEVNKQIALLADNLMPKMMEDQEIQKFTVPGVGTFYTQQVVHASISGEQKDLAYTWLAENGHGELIKEYVHPATLKAWAKAQLEGNMPLPECIHAYYQTTVRLRRK